MTVTVAYIEGGVLYLAPETVPWAYEEAGAVYVREFAPVVTVDGEGNVFLRIPADGTLTYEVWGEFATGVFATGAGDGQLGPAQGSAALSGGDGGAVLASDEMEAEIS